MGRAACAENPLAMRCLLEEKANVNMTNKDGFSALHLAVAHRSDKTVRMLMRCKADSNMQSFKGHSPVSFAKHEGLKDILKILAEERERQKGKVAAKPPG